MDIDPRQLAQLAAIAEHGSFSSAAAHLNVSQPALSSGIAQLERRLSVRVLERGRYGARLTAHGEALVRHWRIISSQLKQAAEEIRHKALDAEGPLTIGVSPVTAMVYVPEAVAALKRRHPSIRITLVEDVHGTTMTKLCNGELDLAVGPVGIFPSTPDIGEVALVHDELGLVIGAGNTRYTQSKLSLHDIVEDDFVLPSESSAFRRQLEALFITSNRAWPDIVTFANSVNAVKAIVIQSNGVTIMPRSMVALECEAGYLRHVELSGINTRRAIGYTWLKSRPLSPIAEQFVEVLAEVCREAEDVPQG